MQCQRLFEPRLEIPPHVLAEFTNEKGLSKYLSLEQLKQDIEAHRPYSQIYLAQAEKFAAAGKTDFARSLLFQIQKISNSKRPDLVILPLRLLDPSNFDSGAAFWQIDHYTNYVERKFNPDSKIGRFFLRLSDMNLEALSRTRKNLALALIDHLYGSVDQRMGSNGGDLHPFLEDNFPQALPNWNEERLQVLLDFFNQVNQVVVSINSSEALTEFADRLDFPLQTDRFLKLDLVQFEKRAHFYELAKALTTAHAGGIRGMPEASLIAQALIKNPGLESNFQKILKVLRSGVDDRMGFRLAAVGNYLQYCSQTKGEGPLNEIGFKMVEAGVLDRAHESHFIMHMDLLKLENLAKSQLSWSRLRQDTFIEVIHYLTDMGADASAIQGFSGYKAYAFFLEAEDHPSLQGLYEALRR